MSRLHYRLLCVFIAIIIGVAWIKLSNRQLSHKDIPHKESPMENIVIYTTTSCPFCVKAKKLLERKNAAYTEINVQDSTEKREEMIKKANGKRTVPQIFIKDEHIGGCDDLYALDEQGLLDEKLR